jgi:uncharacterized protein (UPF0276 family)
MVQFNQGGGVGLGLKRELIAQLKNQIDISPISFFEIAPENWMGAGGLVAKQLDWFVENYPVVCHGLSLSLGSPDPLNISFLKNLKLFLEQYHISLYTEHLSYCSAGGYLYDLLPIPMTEDAVHYVAARIRQTQDILERRIAIENASFYVAAPISEMDEFEFLEAVLTEADCDWHIDVNNIYVNSVNFGFDPQVFLERANKADLGKRVVYGHVAGHYQEAPDLLIDTHGASVIDPVWNLQAEAYRLMGVFPTILERDTNIPPLSDLMPELLIINRLQVEANL